MGEGVAREGSYAVRRGPPSPLAALILILILFLPVGRIFHPLNVGENRPFMAQKFKPDPTPVLAISKF